ncbi:uncharacterized protein NEMAJ01_1434 [Nematocida major]|uniref:uncharacterized protein n=1 Tax=Nematocida major TaxID=1912982 RepID=UPI0020077AE6|nr:uncharacterized protein NEMAJ01_1434 [Nematocida major]KAH9386538.1 hypothetical protein NEMAJ01_1434 [Nematocida major]
MNEWAPPRRLKESPSESLNILPEYPTNITNTSVNGTRTIPIINTTSQNYIPRIDYTALLNSEVLEEVREMLGAFEDAE